MNHWIATIIAAALSAYASAVVTQFGTPVDHALPFIAVGITIVAAFTHPSIQLAVPLLIGGEVSISDERLRLIWFGLVLAIAAAVALMKSERRISIAIAAILLLRWIPLSNVVVWRELLLLAIAVLIVIALRETPLGVAIGVATTLFVPLFPLRTIGYAIAVLVAAFIVRTHVPRWTVASSFALALMILFFAWSGAFARATSLALWGLPRTTTRVPMQMALAPGQAVSIDVPGDACAVILSGANIARLEPGTVVGAIDGKPLRVGDVADWGFLRRDQFHASRNTIPKNSAGLLRDYGQAAWIDGAARFRISATRIRIAADAHLPPPARLQIDAFELVRR